MNLSLVFSAKKIGKKRAVSTHLLTPMIMSTSNLTVNIPKPPSGWIKGVASATNQLQMETSWEGCQIAVAGLPPNGPDKAWAQRHIHAAVRSFTFLTDYLLTRS